MLLFYTSRCPSVCLHVTHKCKIIFHPLYSHLVSGTEGGACVQKGLCSHQTPSEGLKSIFSNRFNSKYLEFVFIINMASKARKSKPQHLLLLFKITSPIISVAPRFVEEGKPVDTKIQLGYSNLLLPCTGVGSPIPTSTWQRIGSKLPEVRV